MTSRDQRLLGTVARAVNSCKVGVMLDEEATTLFSESVDLDQRDEASSQALVVAENPGTRSTPRHEIEQELLAELGNLPLAIAQSAANIRVLHNTVEEYNAMYQQTKLKMRPIQQAELMDEPEPDLHALGMGERSSVALTWELSLQSLARLDQANYLYVF